MSHSQLYVGLFSLLNQSSSWVIFVQTPFQIDLEYMKKEAGTHFRFNRFLVRYIQSEVWSERLMLKVSYGPIPLVFSLAETLSPRT